MDIFKKTLLLFITASILFFLAPGYAAPSQPIKEELMQPENEKMDLILYHEKILTELGVPKDVRSYLIDVYSGPIRTPIPATSEH